MIIEITWQSVINDLLKNDKERSSQVFEVLRSHSALFKEVVEGTGHDGSISVA
jgi:hypothetical protein